MNCKMSIKNGFVCSDCFFRTKTFQEMQQHIKMQHKRKPLCNEQGQYATLELQRMAFDIAAMAEGLILSA